jgi:hypothetical protein
MLSNQIGHERSADIARHDVRQIAFTRLSAASVQMPRSSGPPSGLGLAEVGTGLGLCRSLPTVAA